MRRLVNSAYREALKPIDGITFDIWLVFWDNNWKKFSEVFSKAFTLMKETGSKVTNIHFKKESFGNIEFPEEATCLLEQLRSFEIKNIKVENCVLRISWIFKFFQIKSSQIMKFEKWIFWNKNKNKNKKIMNLEEHLNKEFFFENWKYTDEKVEDEKSIDWNKIKNDKGVECIVNFLNIKDMYKIFTQLRLKNSFGFNNKIYTRPELRQIIGNNEDKIICDYFSWSYENEVFKQVIKEGESEIINKNYNICIKTLKAYCDKAMEYNI